VSAARAVATATNVTTAVVEPHGSSAWGRLSFSYANLLPLGHDDTTTYRQIARRGERTRGPSDAPSSRFDPEALTLLSGTGLPGQSPTCLRPSHLRQLPVDPG